MIYTNREDLVYLQTGRATLALPFPNDAYTGRPDPRFAAETRAMAAQVRAGRAEVALFLDDPTWAIGVDDLVEQTGLRVAERDPQGVVLAAPRG